jgi:RNA polymerase sigma factor (sigma-70 family)
MGIDQLSSDAQAFAGRLIRRKARQLAAGDSFTPADREDIAQDLWLHLVASMDDFDPAKGTIFAFIVTVVERKSVAIWRHHAAEKRDSCRCGSLNQAICARDGTRVELAATMTEDAADSRLGRRPLPPQTRAELVLDVESVLASLPADQRDLCERLKHATVSEVARELGLPRSTVAARARRLRAAFAAAGLREYL